MLYHPNIPSALEQVKKKALELEKQSIERERQSMEETRAKIRELEKWSMHLNDRFWRAFNDSAIAMAIVANDGSFIEVNHEACRFWERSRSELQGTTWQAITYPPDIKGDGQQVDRALRGEIETYQMKKRYVMPDETLKWGWLTVSVIPDERGEPDYMLSQIIDLEKMKEAIEQCEQRE